MDCPIRYETCPICSGTVALWREKETKHGRFTIDRCRSCAYAFVNPRPTVEALAEFYREHGQGDSSVTGLKDALAREVAYPNSTADAERIGSTLRQMREEPGTLLDVGCGYGFLTEEARRQGFDVTAIEIAPHELTIPRELTGTEPVNVSFEEFEPGTAFDVVVLSQILEHAHDVNAWVGKAARLLQPGGVLVVALPNFDSLSRRILSERDPYVTPPVHLNYFSLHNLRLLLGKHGFTTTVHHTFSRFPREALSRHVRCPTPIVGPAYFLVRLASRLFDGTSFAMMLHVYALKTR